MSIDTTAAPAPAPAPAAPADTMLTANPPAAPAAPADSTAAPATGGTDATAPAAGSPEAAAAEAAAAAAAETKTPEQIAAEEAAAKAAEGAPEQYADFTAPENAALDPEVMSEFGNVARELNLPQEKAQLLVDKMQPIIAARQAEQVEVMRETWASEVRADPEYGGVHLEANLVHAARAMTAFATPEFKALLNQSALGNHPEFVRFMVKAGKAIGEDTVVSGGVPATTGGIRSVADTLYPTPSVKK